MPHIFFIVLMSDTQNSKTWQPNEGKNCLKRWLNSNSTEKHTLLIHGFANGYIHNNILISLLLLEVITVTQFTAYQYNMINVLYCYVFQEKRLDTALRVDRTMDLEECRVIQQRIDNFSTV